MLSCDTFEMLYFLFTLLGLNSPWKLEMKVFVSFILQYSVNVPVCALSPAACGGQ